MPYRLPGLPVAGKGNKDKLADKPLDQNPLERRASMTGFCSCKTGIHAIHGNNLGSTLEARFQSFRILLTHLTYVPVGNIDIEICRKCGGAVKVIACIEDPAVIGKILTHLKEKAAAVGMLPEVRAPPQKDLLA